MTKIYFHFTVHEILSKVNWISFLSFRESFDLHWNSSQWCWPWLLYMGDKYLFCRPSSYRWGVMVFLLSFLCILFLSFLLPFNIITLLGISLIYFLFLSFVCVCAGVVRSLQGSAPHITAVDVNPSQTLVAVGNNQGSLCLYRYPCVRTGVSSWRNTVPVRTLLQLYKLYNMTKVPRL